MQIEVGFRTLT